MAEYGETLSRAGFCDVQARDMTGYFIQVLRDELESFEQDKQQFIQVLSLISFLFVGSVVKVECFRNSRAMITTISSQDGVIRLNAAAMAIRRGVSSLLPSDCKRFTKYIHVT